MTITASKLATVAADVNEIESQLNQDAISVSVEDNTITVSAPLDDLEEFTSTNPAQGDGKWIGLVIDTGEDDITKVTYNGTLLTSDDVDEAASVGVGTGSFVLWLKAENLVDNDREITLGTDGKEDTVITITLNDTSVSTLSDMTINLTPVSLSLGLNDSQDVIVSTVETNDFSITNLTVNGAGANKPTAAIASTGKTIRVTTDGTTTPASYSVTFTLTDGETNYNDTNSSFTVNVSNS